MLFPRKSKRPPGLFTKMITGDGKKVGDVASQSKQLYGQGQKNMLIGQVSPCEILSDKNKVLLQKGRLSTEKY